MELMRISGNFKNILRKNKFTLLLLAVGILLLWTPGKSEDVVQTQATQPTTQILTAEEMEAVLREIHGAGEVRVLLSVADGEEIIYQNDSELAQSENDRTDQSETVLITDAQRAQQGLIRQINPPVYLGAVVVCQGADNPSVRLQITQAVSKITGLGADQICVLKMK